MSDLLDYLDMSMEWLNKQFTRPSRCLNRDSRTNDVNSDFTKTLEDNNFKDKDEKTSDELDNLPCCEPESDTKIQQPECQRDVLNPQSILNVQDENYFIIKMQDPFEVYEYKKKEEIIFPACPPKTYVKNPRDTVCTCELCQKNNTNRKCCQQKRAAVFDNNKTAAKLEHA